jgi:hypothetical protein
MMIEQYPLYPFEESRALNENTCIKSEPSRPDES